MILLITVISFSGFVSTTQIPIGNPQVCEQEAKRLTTNVPSEVIKSNNSYTSYAKCIAQTRR